MKTRSKGSRLTENIMETRTKTKHTPNRTEYATLFRKERRDRSKVMLIRPHTRRMSHPKMQLQCVGCPDTEDNDRVH